MMNSMYAEAGKANCATFCEGVMACLTAYLIYFCSETHYEKCLKNVARFVVEQNEQVLQYYLRILVKSSCHQVGFWD